MNLERKEMFVSLHAVATALGVPAAWLKAEAAAPRIPHLRAGRRWLFNLQLVEQVLLERAEAGRQNRGGVIRNAMDQPPGMKLDTKQ